MIECPKCGFEFEPLPTPPYWNKKCDKCNGKTHLLIGGGYFCEICGYTVNSIGEE